MKRVLIKKIACLRLAILGLKKTTQKVLQEKRVIKRNFKSKEIDQEVNPIQNKIT